MKNTGIEERNYLGFRQKITGKQLVNDYLKPVRRRSRRDRRRTG